MTPTKLQELIAKFGFKGEVDVKTVGMMTTLPINGVLTADKIYSRYYILNFCRQYCEAYLEFNHADDKAMAYFEIELPNKLIRAYILVKNGTVIAIEEQKSEEVTL